MWEGLPSLGGTLNSSVNSANVLGREGVCGGGVSGPFERDEARQTGGWELGNFSSGNPFPQPTAFLEVAEKRSESI